MTRIRVPIIGGNNKSVLIDTTATKGAMLGVDFLMPDGTPATPAKLAAYLGVTPNPPNKSPNSSGSSGAAGKAGQSGPPGDDGFDGEPGPPGSAGPTGATGAIGPGGAAGTPGGPMGPPGSDGDEGSEGPPGPPGPAGTGSTGAAGPTGSSGTSGPPGADGADGDDGAPGPPGPTGPAGSGSSYPTSGTPVVGGVVLTGSTGSWANFSFAVRVAGPCMLNYPTSWKFKITVVGAAAKCHSCVARRTLKGSATYVDSTAVAFGGVSTDFTMALGDSTSDAISVTLDITHDVYLIFFFDSGVSGSAAFPAFSTGSAYSGIQGGGFVAGDHTADATNASFSYPGGQSFGVYSVVWA